MFRPVKLARVTIQVPESDVPAVMRVLGEMRMLHLINLQETHLGRVGYRARVDTELVGRYQKVLSRVNRLSAALPSVHAGTEAGKMGREEVPDFRVDREIFRLEERLAAIEHDVTPPVEQMEKVVIDATELPKYAIPKLSNVN